MSSSNTTHIRILDKEYQVSCPVGERQALVESAKMLDQQMRKIKDSGTVLGIERIAVMAALNLTYDLLKSEQGEISSASNERLQKLNNILDEAIHRFDNKSLL